MGNPIMPACKASYLVLSWPLLCLASQASRVLGRHRITRPWRRSGLQKVPALSHRQSVRTLMLSIRAISDGPSQCAGALGVVPVAKELLVEIDTGRSPVARVALVMSSKDMRMLPK